MKGHLVKHTLLGLGSALALFVLLELVLRVAGVGEPAPPSGLHPRAAYLRPEPDAPGYWRTQFDDSNRPEQVAGPPDERVRVMMFGGSNCASFGDRWLGRALDEVAGRGRYEVLNFGRNGYGSQRTDIIMSQALPLLDPDIVWIYTGDIEFMELGYFVDSESVRDDRLPGWLAGLPRVVRRSRTLGLMLSLMAGPPRRDGAAPEPLRRDYESFPKLTYDQTLERYTELERNLREMSQRAVDSGAVVVLSTVVYNHFTPPFSSTYSDDTSQETRRAFEEQIYRAWDHTPEWMRPLLPIHTGHRVFVKDWRGQDTTGGLEAPTAPPRPDGVLPGMRPSLGRLEEADPLLEDSAGWTGKLWALYEALERLHARPLDETDRKELLRAEAALRKAVELVPDHGGAWFQLAIVSEALDRDPDDVRELFEQAATLDRLPRKGNRAINEIIRRVAADIHGVNLFDAQQLFASYVPDGLVGFEWMMDHAHLQAGAREVIMEDLALFLVDRWPAPEGGVPRADTDGR